MIVVSDLRKIARARLEDAAVLCKARRYDGAVYVCGYAVETALKARICRTLKWNAYPSTASEFQKYQSFRTHDLGVLLHLSGRREKIKNEHLAAWSAVADWTPNSRYGVIGSTLAGDATEMLSSAKVLLRLL